MIKKLLITALLATCAMSAHANPTDKQKIIDHLKYFSDDPAESVLSSDGKRRYHKEYSFNNSGGVDVRIREKYLPAVTDGKIIDHKPSRTSYFSFNPKTLKYIGKIGKATNAVGIGLLMIDVLGTGLDDYNVTPTGDVSYTVHGDGKYCVSSSKETWCGDDPQTLCQNWLQSVNTPSYRFADSVKATSSHCLVYGGTYNYNGNVGTTIRQNQPERRVMSEREFDEAVRALAKSGNVNAKTVILDAGKDEIITGKHDDAIERLADDITSDTAQDEPQPENPPSDDDSTRPNPDDDSTTTPDPDGTADKDKDAPKPDGTTDITQDPKTNSNGDFELPPFCSWATIVCEFIGTKPDMPDEPLPTKDVPLKTPAEFDKDYIDFGGQCPADINVDIDLAFAKHTIIYSFTPICDFVQNYLRIVIIICAYLFATIHISSAFKI